MILIIVLLVFLKVKFQKDVHNDTLSNQQQKLLEIFIQNINELLELENNFPIPPLNNSASWLFNYPTHPHTNTSNSRIYVFKINKDDSNNAEVDLDIDDKIYEWKYGLGNDHLREEHKNTFNESSREC